MIDDWYIDKQEFNIYHNELYNISDKEWNTTPCAVLIDGKFVLLKQLSDLKNHSYKSINGILIISTKVYSEYKNKTKLTKQNLFQDGLLLLPNNYFFKKYVLKYIQSL